MSFGCCSFHLPVHFVVADDIVVVHHKLQNLFPEFFVASHRVQVQAKCSDCIIKVDGRVEFLDIVCQGHAWFGDW